MSSSVQPTVALFGGDGRLARRLNLPVDILPVQSSGDGGTRGIRALCHRLRSGTIHAVVVLTKWVGHPAKNQLKRLCVQLGVPYREVWGGLSRVRSTVHHLHGELCHAY